MSSSMKTHLPSLPITDLPNKAKNVRKQTPHKQEHEQWSLISEEALRRVWDNASDAAYDNWRALYDI